MICHKRRFIFVHIRKTAGTSLEAALVHGLEATSRHYAPGNEPVPLRHEGVQCKHRILSEYDRHHIAKYFVFSIVRNPWDRVVSRYHWERQLRRRSAILYKDFRTYILARRGLMPAQWNVTGDNPRKYMTQYECLELDGQIGVDKVWRFEHLRRDYPEIARRLGLTNIPLPHVFQSEHRPYWTYYEDDTREIVNEAYRIDIEAFSYRFAESHQRQPKLRIK